MTDDDVVPPEIIKHAEGDCHACLVNDQATGSRFCESCRDALRDHRDSEL